MKASDYYSLSAVFSIDLNPCPCLQGGLAQSDSWWPWQCAESCPDEQQHPHTRCVPVSQQYIKWLFLYLREYIICKEILSFVGGYVEWGQGSQSFLCHRLQLMVLLAVGVLVVCLCDSLETVKAAHKKESRQAWNWTRICNHIDLLPVFF